MIPVRQTRFGGPNMPPEERGNCLAACVAAVFELPLGGERGVPDVPGDEDGMYVLQGWMHSRGIHMMVLPPPPPGAYWPGYCVAGTDSAFLSAEEGGHAVVALDGAAVWNPNPRDLRPLPTLELEAFCVFTLLDSRSWFADRQHLSESYHGVRPQHVPDGRIDGRIFAPYPDVDSDLVRLGL